jgi:hypothetical protein
MMRRQQTLNFYSAGAKRAACLPAGVSFSLFEEGCSTSRFLHAAASAFRQQIEVGARLSNLFAFIAGDAHTGWLIVSFCA